MGIQGIKKPRHATRCSQSVKIKTLSPPKTKALIFPNLRISKENVDSISLYAQVAKVFFPTPAQALLVALPEQARVLIHRLGRHGNQTRFQLEDFGHVYVFNRDSGAWAHVHA